MLSNTEIGLRISSAREMRGLTLDDIASAVGVARSTIQRYEKGSIAKIKLPVLQAIAGALGVNPNWLIGNTDDPAPVEMQQQLFAHSVSPEEEQLLLDYRDASEEIREEAAGMLHRSAERNRKDGPLSASVS